MTEETQALVAFAGTWVCHHFNPESGADCRELHKGDHDMWCSSCIVLDLAAALTTLARDLETARQERDAALANCKNWWKLRAELATKQNDTLRAERDAAVRAARAETWDQAANYLMMEPTTGESQWVASVFRGWASAAREGQ